MAPSLVAAAAFIALAALAGGALDFLSRRLRRRQDGAAALTGRINDLLPQLQCGECGYPGCRPYAAAVAAGEAEINLCPPGGAATARQLADLLNAEAPPMPPPPLRRVAVIRGADCVGCALCLAACPTDAIVGAARHAHIVIAEDCVGCALCLPPCPADCIDMLPAGA